MELWWITPTDGQQPQATQEQTPVHMERLPAWKQLIMESRQVQTVSMHLMAESKRNRAVLKQKITELRQQQRAILDRESSLLS